MGRRHNLRDEKGWNLVQNHVNETANDYGLNYVTIKSSFRRFINESTLNKLVLEISGDYWWFGFRHGIGLLGHIAPYAYQKKISTVFIASSLTASDIGMVTCASDPSIDNHVRFCGCQIFHDGYDYSRQEKIHRICDFVKKTGK